AYNFVIGGDGFEVLWHAQNTDLVMGTIYNNRIFVSSNGGSSFASSSAGIVSEDGPFITRLASSVSSPDIVYAVGGQGVYKTSNFGQTWTMKSINDQTWGGNSSSNDVEVSLANDNIVWAGAGMATGIVNIFVSTDKGETFDATTIPAVDPRAFATGIYTHPTEENTAYVLFSVAKQAKILKTEDLGQSWNDISGFGVGTESNNGFPDVFTHSLVVMPFDTDVIWAGTEIGIFESLNGGDSWNLRQDMPSVSIWSMKVVDDQIVLGTHGRGIWTATIAELEFAYSQISSFDYKGYGEANINVNLPVQYDKVEILLGQESIINSSNLVVGLNTFDLKEFYQFDGGILTLIAEIGEKTFVSEFQIEAFDRSPEVLNFSTSIDFERNVYPIVIELDNNDPFSKIEVIMNGEIVYTDIQQLAQSDEKRVMSFDYDQGRNNTVLIRSYLKGFVFERSLGGLITSSTDKMESLISLYPVPATTTITLETAGKKISNYSIYTANGKLVNSVASSGSTIITIDISAFEQGVYLLQMQDAQGAIRTKRFIKQ
ncbi:MAG: hypothetical protein ACI9XJ_001639, partial [Marivirga sp.]